MMNRLNRPLLSLLLAFSIYCLGACSPAQSPPPEKQPVITQATGTLPTTPDIVASSTASILTNTGNLRVTFIDVGQGDSILIQTPEGKSMLIDGGEADSGALQYLQANSINRLDVMVASHPHADHIGGLVQILKAISVDTVITNGQPTTTRTYENFLDAIATAKARYVEVKRGDSIPLGNLVFGVLSPPINKGDDLNDNSLVLRLPYGKISFLFTGDAQANAENAMSVSSFGSLQATVLKVAHHGSGSSSSRSFLDLVRPKVAVYSAGKGNQYGHPHPETIANLSAIGAKIYGTDVNGTVIITTDGEGYTVYPTYGQERGPPVNTNTSPTSSPLVSPIITIPSTEAPVPFVPALPTTIAPTQPSTVVQPTNTVPSPEAAPLTLDILSVTSRVRAGSNATLAAKTSPGAACQIAVYYKSGPSSAQGLSPKSADAGGGVSWTWMVGTRTTPGTWRIVVTATKDGQSITKDTTFEVN